MGLAVRTIAAFAVALISLWVLEVARNGVDIQQTWVGQTPVTIYAAPDATGPAVFVAHGFAGSQQMMQGFALPLARAGYRVFAFEFLGHGRHPLPMSGDVTTVEGTTRFLMDQTNEVIDALKDDASPVALLGHSMATDVLVRVATERSDVGPVVLISAFSQVIDAVTPQDLLLVTGAWEPGLRGFALEALQMVVPEASEGDTVKNGSITRRAVAAPFTEHVSILQSRVARAEAVAWLDEYFARTSRVTVLPTGFAIIGLLGGLVVLFPAIARLLPRREVFAASLTKAQLAASVLVPASVTPLVAGAIELEVLPVLVADYLALHLLIFGVLQIVLLRFWGVGIGRFSWCTLVLLLAWCGVFAVALDRYAANFWPSSGRLWVISAILLGALPYMLADAVLTTRAPFWRRLFVRLGFLVSLAIAVALDFEGLFFLIMIAPVLVLFYLVFGTVGRQAAYRAGPLSSGIALGMVLAWALGVSFPMFQAVS
ncbi:Alpha/beta hydrolase family protein [Boseongicola aestuarii]|uniref:Alpha/beta hydrolase family protein n=1 Tax=Boseongicola aestuarii TaxID=1470561 RepID=A0A238J0H6_9RHOB|nr:Alpha/beta hydrolase family protein [Boseongicola aestuarii]